MTDPGPGRDTGGLAVSSPAEDRVEHRFDNPPPPVIAELLRNARSIAVIGISPKQDRPSHQVSAAMQRYGYRIVPVRPGARTILEERCYARLADVPTPIDIVNAFVGAGGVEAVVEQCIDTGAPVLWLQCGADDPVAARRACNAGIVVVMDLCISRTYRELVAGDDNRRNAP